MAFTDRVRLPNLNLIHRRPRLLDKLTAYVESRYRLITVYAPSGFGKSIMLADYALTTDLPICWCALAPEDRDPTVFLTLLAYSITDRFREIDPGPLINLVKQGDTQLSIRRIATVLANVGPHVIILDDYHKAISAGMNVALNRLLEYLPDTSTIIVAARGNMGLATGQILDLLIAEQATGLSEEELRFTGEEIQRVMRKRFGRQIELETAATIANATDGNIAQILLTGHMQSALVGEMIISLKDRLGEDRQIIYGYLADEVFGKQPPDLQRFMLITSVLPDMTPDICNALLEIADAQKCLETLIHRDLFITQVGASFKYHDLFAEFLRSRLLENETLYKQTVHKAACLLTDGARYEAAMNLHLSIQAWDEAAVLLEGQGRFFYDTGRALTLHHWLEQMSEEELTRYPKLLLLKGQVLNDDLSDPQAAMTYFRQAEAQFLAQDELIDAAAALIWQSISLRMMGRVKESLVLAQRGLHQFESHQAREQAMAYAIRNRGLAYGTAGNIPEALSDLRTALALYESLDDTYRVGMCHQEIGVCLTKQGQINASMHHYRKAIRIWETLGNSNDLANTFNSVGVLLCTVGRYQEALQHFTDSLEIAEQIGATRRAAFAQAGIADAHFGLKAYGPAIEAYQASIELAYEAQVQSLEAYNLARQGDCLFEQDNLSEALTLAARARTIALETGLVYERGLAATLQAKIFVRRGEYESSFPLFEEALSCLSQNELIDQIRVRLWWGLSLLLGYRPSKALRQLEAILQEAPTLTELQSGLEETIRHTQQLLLHFFHSPNTPPSIRDSIHAFLMQSWHSIDFDRPDLQVYAFGPPVLAISGQRRQFTQRGGSRKTPELLLYLIVKEQQGGCRWNDVCADLWPEEPSERASVLFHQNLKRLRKVVLGADDYIILQDDYYRLDTQLMSWCDVIAFETLLATAAQLPSDERLALQLEIVMLYRGEFLAGFDVGEWAATYRVSCEVRFLQTVRLAAEQLLEDGAVQEAIQIIQKGLGQDNFREDLHRLLLRAYAHLGMYGHLADHYRQLCESFEQEFGLLPDPQTEALYRHLMSQGQTVQ